MEVDGHPSQDMLEELETRGAVRAWGSTRGPNADAVRFVLERLGDAEGLWLFLPGEVFQTDIDEPLG